MIRTRPQRQRTGAVASKTSMPRLKARPTAISRRASAHRRRRPDSAHVIRSFEMADFARRALVTPRIRDAHAPARAARRRSAHYWAGADTA